VVADDLVGRPDISSRRDPDADHGTGGVDAVFAKDDTAKVGDEVVEDGVADDANSDEHVTVASHDGVLVDLSAGSATDHDTDAGDVANGVVMDGTDGRRRVSFERGK
jgi:hypothetical protein